MRYLTIPETYRANAAQHQSRGDFHLAAGRPKYAAGSFRKRDRWLKRAAEYDALFNSSIFPDWDGDRLHLDAVITKWITTTADRIVQEILFK